MRAANVKVWSVPVLAALAVPAGLPVAAGETETSYGLALVTGFDSNPLQVMGDGFGGMFSQLRLDGGVTRYVGSGSTVAFFIDGRVALRDDESRTAAAAADSGDARAGMVLAPSFAGRRLLVSLGGRLSAYRGTFTDPETGRVYEAAVVPATDPPSTLPIPDRLDVDNTGAFLNLRWKASRHWSFSLETALDRADYVDDYAEASLDSLDHHSVTLRPGAKLRFGDAASLGFNVALTDLEYDDRPALDGSGTEVPGTRRNYRYSLYEVALRVKPSTRWDLDMGLNAGGREDTYAGYYDSASNAGYVGLGRALGKKSRVSAGASMRTLDYDHATVTGDPLDDAQGSDERRYFGQFTRGFGERLTWRIEGGTEQVRSNDPVFSHDRDWILTGLRFGS